MFGDGIENSAHPELFQGDYTGWCGGRPTVVILRVETLTASEFEWLLAYADVIGATAVELIDEELKTYEECVVIQTLDRGFPEIYAEDTARAMLVR